KSGLLLRTAPTRGSKVVRSVPYGKVVSIYCKTTGDHVSGNNRWYLLTNGTWAWGSAHYIANIGPAPRWC
ncbi:SH3 domain-containing protein, partial [Streptomyces sp. NPDC055261]